MKIEIRSNAGNAVVSFDIGNSTIKDFTPIGISCLMLAHSYSGLEGEDAEKWTFSNCFWRIPAEMKEPIRKLLNRDANDPMKTVYGLPAHWIGGNRA